MLLTLDKELFSRSIGQNFRILDAYSGTVALELLEVSGTAAAYQKQPSCRQETENITSRREPFSLIFRGPMDSPLPQRMYDLHCLSLGTLERLFLVPIGADDTGRTYEAVFG
jgi:hypothetical protein